ncbi:MULTISPECIES: fimbrial protein [Dyella]|nr:MULTISPECIES: fimbrial protein [Dyella]
MPENTMSLSLNPRDNAKMGTRHRIVWRALTTWLLVAFALLAPLTSHAEATCERQTTEGQGPDLGSEAHVMPRDAPIGTQLTPFSPMTPFGMDVWRCSFKAGESVWLKMSGYIPTGFMSNGRMVYQTAVDGVGYVLGAQAFVADRWIDTPEPEGIPVNDVYTVITKWTAPQDMTDVPIGLRTTIALVKYGPVTGGKLAHKTGVGLATVHTHWDRDGYEGGITLGSMGEPTFVGLSCKTSDVNVTMRDSSVHDLKTPGSVGDSADFDIKVESCNSGLGSIRYRLDPAPGIPAINSAEGIIGLAASSGAKGYGIQVTNASDQPVALGEFFDTHSSSDTTIPLRARYYRTGGNAMMGTADSAMVLSMSYE